MIPVLFILAGVLAIYALFLFARKVPLPCFHYLVLSPEERAAVLTPREYRNAGLALLLFALACAAGYLVYQVFPGWFVKYVVVLAACLLLYFFTYDLTPRKWEEMPESHFKDGSGSGRIL
jgi:hypothetical protein